MGSVVCMVVSGGAGRTAPGGVLVSRFSLSSLVPLGRSCAGEHAWGLVCVGGSSIRWRLNGLCVVVEFGRRFEVVM